MIVGYSLIEGVGSALMTTGDILITVACADVTRAKYLGRIPT